MAWGCGFALLRIANEGLVIGGGINAFYAVLGSVCSFLLDREQRSRIGGIVR